jgi:CRISPR/Cas system CSM-associated protein Csm2 small subunit
LYFYDVKIQTNIKQNLVKKICGEITNIQTNINQNLVKKICGEITNIQTNINQNLVKKIHGEITNFLKIFFWTGLDPAHSFWAGPAQ